MNTITIEQFVSKNINSNTDEGSLLRKVVFELDCNIIVVAALMVQIKPELETEFKTLINKLKEN